VQFNDAVGSEKGRGCEEGGRKEGREVGRGQWLRLLSLMDCKKVFYVICSTPKSGREGVRE